MIFPMIFFLNLVLGGHIILLLLMNLQEQIVWSIVALHVLPRFLDTLPRPITDVCIDVSVYPFLNTLRNFLFDMPPITQSFWFCCIKI